MLGRSRRTERGNGCCQGRLGGKSFQAFADPALIHKSIKLILNIESTAQEISFRKRGRMGKERRQLRRHARQGDHPQGVLNRSAKRLQERETPAPMRKLRDVTKRRVTAKKLVAPKTRERNFEAELRRHIAHQIRIESVNRGLVHAIEKGIGDGFELRPTDAISGMFTSKGPRGGLGERSFVVICSGIFIECKCDAL